jgi:hypothetical protein
MNDIISIDFETFYSRKLKYSLKVMIAEQYCRSPLFDPYIIAACDGTQSWVGHPKDFNWGCLAGKTVLAHNAYFEQNVIIELERRGMIPKGTYASVKEFHCTSNMCRYLCNRGDLASAVEHLLKVHVSKQARADADGKHWPDDFTPEQRKDMLKYATHDPFYCIMLWQKCAHLWPEHERRLSQLSIDAGIRGVQIDKDLLEKFIIETHEMKLNTEKVLPWIAGAEDEDDESWDEFKVKPTSTKCIAEQCRRDGIPCCPVKSDDEEAYEEWENTYAPTHPWIHALGSWRSINRLYKIFLVLKARLRSDGTMPFELKYFGAHTGRWAGGSKFNMQNMSKRPIFCNETGLLEVNEERIHAALKTKEKTGAWPEWVRYAVDLRNIFIARPGMKMITADLSQIEPRVLAWLAGDKVMLERMAAGDSPYVAHARATMDYTGADLKTEDPKRYALAKARVLALGYQAGWEKFILMAKVLAGLDITKDDPETVEEAHPITGEVKMVSGYGFNAKRIVKEFREQSKKVVALWNKLDTTFKCSIGRDFVMNLPSGRKMVYERVRCEARFEKDPETLKPKRKTVFTAQIGERRFITYGGKLTENVTQAVARDAFAVCVLNLCSAQLPMLFSVHDEAVLEVPLDTPVSKVEEEMSRPIPWLPGCTIAADVKEVPCYQK